MSKTVRVYFYCQINRECYCDTLFLILVVIQAMTTCSVFTHCWYLYENSIRNLYIFKKCERLRVILAKKASLVKNYFVSIMIQIFVHWYFSDSTEVLICQANLSFNFFSASPAMCNCKFYIVQCTIVHAQYILPGLYTCSVSILERF